LAFIFVILLFVLVNFGGKDSSPSETAENTEENTNNDETSSEKANNSNQEETSNAEDNETNENNEENNDDSEDNEDNEDNDSEEVDSDDPNVTKAYKGEWDPVDTEQSGDHTTNYDDGSQDRTEIKQAVSDATGVSEDQMIEHWVGNQGEQKVTSTIQDESTDQF